MRPSPPAPFDARLGLLRGRTWLRIAEREGPSAEAERAVVETFEHVMQAPAAATADVIAALELLEAYLVLSGRFAELASVREQALPLLPADAAELLVGPRAWVASIAAELMRRTSPSIFEEALAPTFLAHVAHAAAEGGAEQHLRLMRTAGSLPDGRSTEMLLVAMPTPVRTGEPLWIAWARVAGSARVHLYTLEWAREGAKAQTYARMSRMPFDAVRLGEGARAPVNPHLGPRSPHFLPFVTAVAQHLLQVESHGSLAPAALPTVPPPAPAARARRNRKGPVLAILAVVGVLGIDYGLTAWSRIRDRDATWVAYRDRTERFAAGETPPAAQAFSCAAAVVAADDVAVLLRDETGLLPAPGRVHHRPGGARPTPFVVRGVLRGHDSQPTRHLVEMDLELFRLDESSADGEPAALLCGGRVRSRFEGEAIGPGDLVAVATRAACEGLSFPRCEWLRTSGGVTLER